MSTCVQCGEPLGSHEVTVSGRPSLRVSGLPVRTCPKGHLPPDLSRSLGALREHLGNALAASPSLRAAAGSALALTIAPEGEDPAPLRATELLPPPQRDLHELVLDPDVRGAIERLIACHRARERVRDAAGPFLADLAARARLCMGGPSGVGKTEVAKGLGKALGLPVLKVDAARVKCRLVGDAEKAFRAAFTEAEARGAILFFDEADTLLAARVATEDAAGVHYNGQVNFLLQELDRFPGVVVCATNALDGLDAAIQRRFDVVRIQAPDAALRRRTWGELLRPTALRPAATPAWIARLDGLVERHIAAHPTTPPFTPGEMQLVIVDAIRRMAVRGTSFQLSRLDVQRALEDRLVARVPAADTPRMQAERARTEVGRFLAEHLRGAAQAAREQARTAEVSAAAALATGPHGKTIAERSEETARMFRAQAEDFELACRLSILASPGGPTDLEELRRALRDARTWHSGPAAEAK